MFQSPQASPPALRSVTTRPVESPVTTNQHCMGACVQGVEKRQDTRSACTIIGALHTHIVCGVASALACGVVAHLCQSVQILCVPVPGPINSLNCETVRKSPRAVCFPRPERMFAKPALNCRNHYTPFRWHMVGQMMHYLYRCLFGVGAPAVRSVDGAM